MAKNFNSNSPILPSMPTSIRRPAQPSPEFYSVFYKAEILGLIDALETRREFPLKYSYKGRGAKIWNNFYLKYLIPTWYRTSNVEIDLLRDNFKLIYEKIKGCNQVNVIDVGAGNSYPVKAFVRKLNKLVKIDKYIALDISEELLNLSYNNFTKWYPSIEFFSKIIDIETSCLPQELLKNQTNSEGEDIANIILHLGVTMGNHHNRIRVLENFRDSMGKNDLLVFTNEIGSNSNWDGGVRGGLKYHADQIYAWIKDKMEIRAEDCELVRKYDLKTDSLVANIKFHQDYTLNFSFKGIERAIDISKGEEITIWRHHKYEIPELQQELEQAGLTLVHYSTNKYLSHIMVICEVG